VEEKDQTNLSPDTSTVPVETQTAPTTNFEQNSPLTENLEPVSPDQSPKPPASSNKFIKLLLFIGIPLIIISASAFFMIISNQKAENTVKVEITPQVTPSPVPFTLSITSPSEGDVITENKVTVKGITYPNTAVLVHTETDASSVDSDTAGDFETEITLEEGINTINVTAFAVSGKEERVSIDIVYEGQVKGVKSDEVSKNVLGKATIGNVKEVKKNSLLVTDDETEVETSVFVDTTTQIINDKKKNIKISAIKKDSKVAVVNEAETETSATGSGTKKIAKIYVKENTGQSKRSAVSGIITDISSETITLSHQIQVDRIYTLTTTENTVYKMKDSDLVTISDLVIGMRIAAVGDKDENGNLTVIRVHVIPGKASGVYNNITSPTPNISSTPSASLSPSATSTPSITSTLSPTP